MNYKFLMLKLLNLIILIFMASTFVHAEEINVFDFHVDPPTFRPLPFKGHGPKRSQGPMGGPSVNSSRLNAQKSKAKTWQKFGSISLDGLPAAAGRKLTATSKLLQEQRGGVATRLGNNVL